MSNSVYDKIIENLRKVVKIRLDDNAKHCKKYLSKSSFVSQRIFSRFLLLYTGLNQFKC